jgi:hypothetical protein
MKMKMFFGSVSLSALIFAGCADSVDTDRGGAPTSEMSTGSSDPNLTNSDPGVASDTGTYGEPSIQSADQRFNSLGSASAPSANVPANVATNETETVAQENNELSTGLENEQATQISTEPNTGDDANPDQVQPQQ